MNSRGQKIERKYMDLEDVKEIILREVEGMKDHNKFYFGTNLFYVLCKPKIQAAIDALNLDEEDGLFYCKMIENVIPDYFMNVLMISPSENNRIINELIKEYFKVWSAANSRCTWGSTSASRTCASPTCSTSKPICSGASATSSPSTKTSSKTSSSASCPNRTEKFPWSS